MVGNHLREEILTSCKATAMIYNDSQKKWLHCAANGPAKVQLLFAAESQTYRIVGRQIQDHEVVLNHSISKGIKYNQATATFHQWRDQSSVYGLNFSSKLDAQEFGTTMLKILESVNGSATVLVNGGATLPPVSTNTPSYKRQSSQPPVSTVDDEETNYALISDSCQFYGESKPSAIPPAPPLNLPTSNGPPPPPPPPPPVAPPPTRKSLAPQMDLMSEMAAKFAQRRKLLDDNDKPETINVKNVTKIGPTPLTNTSPCVTRKVNETNGSTTSIDWDKFKGELLADIRKEIDKAKQEILSALLDQHTKI